MEGMSGSISCTIAPEVLTDNNYGSWKIWLKNYLLGQGLWDIVEGTETKPEDLKLWTMRNAKALHTIQITCGAKMFSLIKEKDSAKDAWDCIASSYQSAKVKLSVDAETSSTEQGSTTCDYSKYLPLYKAIHSGDCVKVKSILEEDPEARRSIISSSGVTPLHLAILVARWRIVYDLVLCMDAKVLEEIRSQDGDTALTCAAAVGKVKVARAMVEKNRKLLSIKNENGFLPVVVAAYRRNEDMTRYLFEEMPREMLAPEADHYNGAALLTIAITADMYDIALKLLRVYPRLAIIKDNNNETALTVLARRHSAFPSANRYAFWQQWIYSGIHVTNIYPSTDGNMDKIIQGSNKLLDIFFRILDQFVPGMKQIHHRKLMNNRAIEVLKVLGDEVSTLKDQQLVEAGVHSAIFVAVENGLIEFVVEIIKSQPLLLWVRNPNGESIIKAAVVHRQEKIFNLIHGMGGEKARLVRGQCKFGNNILHLAARLATSSQLDRVAGAALQMQRELQWFKEVESIVNPRYLEEMNDDGKVPRTLFTEEHKHLVKEGEKWMKDTATACMVVSTLIATVMFAATFTVPGGTFGDTGVPVFHRHKAFMVFIISDTLSLYSATTSVLMFLYILTSRYAEGRFLKTLPKRLIIGLASLFISIASMMVAFGATLYLTLSHGLEWVAIPLSVLAAVPVSLYALLQYPLFFEIVSSTYGSGIFDHKAKHLLH